MGHKQPLLGFDQHLTSFPQQQKVNILSQVLGFKKNFSFETGSPDCGPGWPGPLALCLVVVVLLQLTEYQDQGHVPPIIFVQHKCSGFAVLGKAGGSNSIRERDASCCYSQGPEFPGQLASLLCQGVQRGAIYSFLQYVFCIKIWGLGRAVSSDVNQHRLSPYSVQDMVLGASLL